MNIDHELWQRIREGNQRAFAELFYRYSSKIYSNAYSYIRDSAVCEQIVHDVFLTLWNNRSTLKVESFQAYLTSASRYRVYKSMNASKANPIDYRENMEDHLPEYGSYAVKNEGISNMECQDINFEVDRYLKSLPKRCREIFVLSRKNCMSNDEIAAQLGISKRTVENQLTHALRHLRISLKDVSVTLIILYILSATCQAPSGLC